LRYQKFREIEISRKKTFNEAATLIYKNIVSSPLVLLLIIIIILLLKKIHLSWKKTIPPCTTTPPPSLSPKNNKKLGHLHEPSLLLYCLQQKRSM
jgi:hypothetical protein